MSYKAWYNQDADYNTNAKSYMDYLARHNKFMKVLVEDYEVFKEILIEEFKQFQLNTDETIDSFQERLDTIKQEMIDFFNQWLEDGVLDEVINQDILNSKANQNEVTELITTLTKTTTDVTERGINVKSLGAVGDGITDDTEAIQNALNQAYDNGGGTVFIPSGVYKTTYPLYFRQGVNIKGQNVATTRIVKEGSKKLTNNLTYAHSQLGNINYNDYDAILLGIGSIGDIVIEDLRLEGMSGNDNELKNDYGLLIFQSHRLTLNRLFFRYVSEGITLSGTWNTVLQTVRVQFSETAFKIGSWDVPTSTSVSFNNTFSDYSAISYHLTNLTYFSGESMCSDFSTTLAYYFDTSYGSITGLGIEYAQGQWIKCHRSTINIGGMYNIGANEFTKKDISLSNAFIEVTSVSRIGTGLTIISSELRVNSKLNNLAYHIDNGSFVHFIGSNIYQFISNTDEGFRSESSSFNRQDDTLRYSTRQFQINNVEYSNDRLLPQRTAYRADGRGFKYWDFDTSTTKTQIIIPVNEIKKAFPNFIDPAGRSFSIPYKLTIKAGTEGSSSYLYDVMITHKTIDRSNERVYPLDSTLIQGIEIDDNNLTINVLSNTNTWYVNITEL